MIVTFRSVVGAKQRGRRIAPSPAVRMKAPRDPACDDLVATVGKVLARIGNPALLEARMLRKALGGPTYQLTAGEIAGIDAAHERVAARQGRRGMP